MIDLRQVYEVKYRRHRHGRDGRTKRTWRATAGGAATHLAWRMIWDKYGAVDGHPRGLTCQCDDERAVYGDAPWEHCPLHDHETGYYRRLHDRLAAFIVSTIRAQEVSGE